MPFDLREQTQMVTQVFAAQAHARGLEFTLQFGPDVPRRVIGDALRLREVLGNLVSNATKFTASGSVQVLLETLRQDAREALVRFAVVDTGIGIPRHAQERIFESFVQGGDATGQAFGGSGLGLAIAKQLVEIMGGEIGVESAPGGGSTFWFTLPLALAAPSAAAEAGEAFPAAVRSPLEGSVLLVEDNRINIEVVSRMLTQLGCTVVVAGDGRAALEQLAKRSFDVVLMDCRLPVMDGYATTAAIRRNERATGRHQCVIALTAQALEGDREACLAAGMDDFLAKPFRPQELHAMLFKHLAAGRAASGPISARRVDTESQSAAGDPMPVLVRSALEHMIQAGNEGLLRRVLELFRSGVPEQVDALHCAAATCDLAAVGSLAHSVGSSARNIGGSRLAALCQEIEAATRATQLSEVQALAARLPAELAALLAALDGHPLAPAVEGADAASRPAVRRSLLIVDDAEDHRLLSAHALSGAGFEVHLADTAETALREAARIRPEIVLMDVGLPGMDGYACCEQLLALPECRHTRVVMVSGVVLPESAARARAAGAIGIIQKVDDWCEFVRAVEAFVAPDAEA